MAYISKATEYNWAKLKSSPQTKLTKRANKTQSTKRFAVSEYLDNELTNNLLNAVLLINDAPENIIYSLCLEYLENRNIIQKDNVKKFISELNARYNYHRIHIIIPKEIWDIDGDVLGFIYQSIITEGEKNLTGQYYTNKKIIEYIIKGKQLNNGETFLDPCCGSGAFLLAVTTNTPECLYGFDINPIAVMITTTNLLVKYANYDFIPNIFCIDFLQCSFLFSCKESHSIPYTFGNIYTNPPWGADRKGEYYLNYPSIKSKERSSMVIIESLNRLNNNGNACFVLPTSLLKIKTHNDIRKYILSRTTIQRIDFFANRFDGVFTDYFSIQLTNTISSIQEYYVSANKEQFHISLSTNDIENGNIAIANLSSLDYSIITKLEYKRYDD